MQSTHRVGLVLTTLAALLLLALPANAQILNAQVGQFGTVVKVGDPDYVPLTKADAFPLTVNKFDVGTPTVFDDDCVIMNKDSLVSSSSKAAVGVDDLLLTPCFGKAPGAKVSQSDILILSQTQTLHNVSANTITVRYIDVNDDGKFNPAEPVYLTTRASTTSTGIDPTSGTTWTIRLTPAFGKAAGTFVKAADAENVQYAGKEISWTSSFATPTVVEREDKGWYILNQASWAKNQALPVNSLRVGLTTTFSLQPGVIPVGIEIANPDNIAAGQDLPVIVTVSNGGAQTGVGLLATKLDKQLVDARLTPVLSPGEQTKILLTLKVPYGGPLEIEVNDLFQVVNAAGSAPSSTAGGAVTQAQLQGLQTRLAELETQVSTGGGSLVKSEGSPSLAGIATLGALVLVGAVLRRRQA